MGIDYKMNPKYPLTSDLFPHISNMWADLSSITLYGFRVKWLGAPRQFRTLRLGINGCNVKHVEDIHTGRWFIVKETFPTGYMAFNDRDETQYQWGEYEKK